MDTGDNNCIWYVCKICNRAYQNRLEFLMHRSEAHAKTQSLETDDTDPFFLFKEIRDIKMTSDFEFDTIDTSSLFKIGRDPASLAEWESSFGEEIQDIVVSMKSRDEMPQTNTKKRKPKSNPVRCEICNKLYSSKHTLKTHMKIHDGQKSFECEECHKQFSQKINLKYHVRTHTGEKPHICTFCKKSFAQIANLSTHVRRRHAKQT